MKKLSVILALAMLLVSAKDVRSQSDDAPSRETLKGLNALGVQVVLNEPCARSGYLAAVLQNEVEFQLRIAGIKVLTPGTPAQVILRVTLLCHEVGESIKGYAFTQQSEVL
jgi:hypothetical protein